MKFDVENANSGAFLLPSEFSRSVVKLVVNSMDDPLTRCIGLSALLGNTKKCKEAQDGTILVI